MILAKIEELKAEVDLYCSMRDDYIVSRIPVHGIRTDGVYNDFCRRHPDVHVSQRKFSNILCAEFGLKSVQSSLDGERGYFYEYA